MTETAPSPAAVNGAPEAVGPLALIGGGEWQDGASYDRALLERAEGRVLIVPTAAAYEHPERAVARARDWFGAFGGEVDAAMVLARKDAEDPAFAAQIRKARFIYLCGGSPLHLRSVMKDSAVLVALVQAWHDGAVIAGSSAGAMVLTDPMVDPRGGAFTVGLGLLRDVAVVPHYRGEWNAQLRRTVSLTPPRCALVALGEQSALIREPDGSWHVEGRREYALYVDRRESDLFELAGKSIW